MKQEPEGAPRSGADRNRLRSRRRGRQAGDDGKLVAYYERNGFTRTEAFTYGEDRWPGQVLARRV